MSEIYKCVCMRCGEGYESSDASDLDGGGKCQPCAEKHRVIAAEVDAKIRAIQGIRLPVVKEAPPIVPGTNFIDAKAWLRR